MNASKPNFYKKSIQGKYSIQRKLKAGGFGSVYVAKDLKQANRNYAIKLMPMSAKKYADIQLHIYELLQKHKVTTGFVKFYDNGIFMDHKYLLMELIGKDLDQLKKQFQGDKMSVKTILMIGLQMIDRLEALHRIGYIHRDVKPDNLAIGLLEKSKIIYLFDFGLAHPIGAERPQQQKGKVIGTLGFMSCRAHEGKDQFPSDDIESLIYTLLFLAEGTLPWLKLQIRTSADFHKILLAKRGLTRKSFKNQNIPNELFKILQNVQRSKQSQKIDYLQIKFRLLQCLKQIEQVNDFAFDWLSPSQRKNQPLSPLKKKHNDSPIDQKRYNKKLQLMNEENQQIVQNQIYQVYKFMENNKEKGQSKQKKNKSKSKSPPKKVAQKKQQVNLKQAIKKRPVSAANKPKKQMPKGQQWQKIINFQNTNYVSGPKIVINKTAKHKI